MGARSILCIYHNSHFVATQNGTGDGHPEVTGLAILRWLLIKANIQRLLSRFHLVQPPPANHDNKGYENSFISLNLIVNSTRPIEHLCKLDLASGSERLWREWTYVIDLDARALEVYERNNNFCGPMQGRFAEAGAVRQVLKATFSFADLPGDGEEEEEEEEEFVRACYREDGPTMMGGWRSPQVPREFEADVLARQAEGFVRRQTAMHAPPVAFTDEEEGDDSGLEDEEDEVESGGTRHLVCVYHHGAFVVAQYGAWDGFLEIAGLAVLRFLTPENVLRLRERIHLVPPPVPRNVEPDSKAVSILGKIASAKRAVKHSYQLGFASNGGMCAWCYVVDLDAGVLEVYRGISAGRVPRLLPPYRSVGAGRLAGFGVTQQVLQAVFSFDDLPGDEDAFMVACGDVRGEDGYFDWSL
jgi:hypothetical protein